MIKYWCFFLTLPLFSFGQKHDYTWLFGYESDLSTPGIEGVRMNFNQQPPVVTPISLGVSLNISNAMISDSSGNLLFYTDGCRVIGADHQLLENGDGLNPGEVRDIQCEGDGLGYTAGVQSCLVLPHPTNSNLYYLFHKHIIYEYEPVFRVITDALYYSLIDVSLKSGNGSIIDKNVVLIDETLTYGQLTATKHANGKDWWIITAGYHNNKYYIFLLSQDGIELSSIQEIGVLAEDGGQANFSPDGTKYARYNALDGVYIFDFNRGTGNLNDFHHLEIPTENISDGIAFSSNSRFLYICTRDTIFQYDMESPSLEFSQQVVAVYDGYQSLFNTTFFNAQLAPDCKIYINTFAAVDVLHVIHNPNEPGIACNVEQHAIQLPFWHLRTLPYFPNYRLGPLVEGEDPPPPCEPVVSTEEEEPPSRQKAYVFPNPAPGYFKVVFEEALRRPGRVVLYNGLGQAVLEEALGAGSREFRLELGDVPPGLYFYSVLLEGVLVKGGKLVVVCGW
ncbi:MAG: hypothetical protein H6558_09945 [Lewinellaceae bacterium]|nr:hypothetical protein [Lewinellaceae bacterium]